MPALITLEHFANNVEGQKSGRALAAACVGRYFTTSQKIPATQTKPRVKASVRT